MMVAGRFSVFILLMILCSSIAFAQTTTHVNVNITGNATIKGAYLNVTNGTIYGDGSGITGLNFSASSVNQSTYWGIYHFASDLNGLILSYWANITGRPTHLSNLTDDLGNRNYTHLSNFTDNLGNRNYTHLSNFTDDTNYSLKNTNYSNTSGEASFTKVWNGSVFYGYANEAMSKGDLVYVCGAESVPVICLARANSENSMPAMGVLEQDLNSSQIGRVLHIGLLETYSHSFAIGDVLYVSTTEYGGFTNVKPAAPNVAQTVGVALNGSLFIIGDISNANFASVSTYSTNSTNAGNSNTSTYATNATNANFANSSTTSTYADNASNANFANSSTTSTYSTNASNANFANSSTTSTYATNATNAGTANTSNYSSYVNESNINSSIIQRRVGATCTTGIGIINENGTIVCSASQLQRLQVNGTKINLTLDSVEITVPYAVDSNYSQYTNTSNLPAYLVNGSSANLTFLIVVNNAVVGNLTVNENGDGQYFYNDGDDVFHKWSDGTLELSSNETNTVVQIGKNGAGGSGTATLIFQDDSGAYHTDLIQNDATFNIQTGDSGHNIVVNDDGEHTDFRVETDTDSYAFYVEGSTNNIGINDSTPENKLTVVGNVSATNFLGNVVGNVTGNADTSTYATNATNCGNANTSTYATNATGANLANYSINATAANTANFSINATNAGIANFSVNATNAGNANTSTYATNATASNTANTSTYATNATNAGTANNSNTLNTHTEANLNVNSSVYWGSYANALGLNNTHIHGAANVTSIPTNCSIHEAFTGVGSALDTFYCIVFMQNFVEDTTPQAGGNIDGMGFNITNLSNVDASGACTGYFCGGGHTHGSTEITEADPLSLKPATAIAVTSVNTGQGAYELYAMNQDVESTDAVTFATVDTGQGANELYDMNQNVQTTDAVTFVSLDTGNGASEVYPYGTLTDGTVCFYTASGTTIACTKTIDASGDCTGDLCGGGHTHSSYLTDIVSDTTPQLGGNLDGRDNNITAITTIGSTTNEVKNIYATNLSIGTGQDMVSYCDATYCYTQW